MARVHKVASSKVAHRCHQGHDIQPPEGYSWAAPGFRARKKFACAKHPFRPSQLTTSAVSSVLAAHEALQDELDGIDTTETYEHADLVSIWDNFVEEVRSFAEERREAAEAWENGNSEMEERADQAEAGLGEAESFEVEEFEPDEQDDDTSDEDWEIELNEQRIEWLNTQVEAMRDAADAAMGEIS